MFAITGNQGFVDSVSLFISVILLLFIYYIFTVTFFDEFMLCSRLRTLHHHSRRIHVLQTMETIQSTNRYERESTLRYQSKKHNRRSIIITMSRGRVFGMFLVRETMRIFKIFPFRPHSHINPLDTIRAVSRNVQNIPILPICP